MMNLMLRTLALSAIVGMAMHTPASAHHSFAMFDRSHEVELKDATVVEWQWTSPHTWLYVYVPNGTPNPDKYSIEGGNPGQLRRLGFVKSTFMPGDKVTVYISPLKSGDKGGALLMVVLTDGTTLGAHWRVADE
jgi:hypothetical protein